MYLGSGSTLLLPKDITKASVFLVGVIGLHSSGCWIKPGPRLEGTEKVKLIFEWIFRNGIFLKIKMSIKNM